MQFNVLCFLSECWMHPSGWLKFRSTWSIKSSLSHHAFIVSTVHEPYEVVLYPCLPTPSSQVESQVFCITVNILASWHFNYALCFSGEFELLKNLIPKIQWFHSAMYAPAVCAAQLGSRIIHGGKWEMENKEMKRQRWGVTTQVVSSNTGQQSVHAVQSSSSISC